MSSYHVATTIAENEENGSVFSAAFDIEITS
jgi:hypothetical protein